MDLKTNITNTYALGDDGTVQITFTIPYKLIKDSEAKAIEELSKDVEISGFRKGKAPKDKIRQNISQEKLVGTILNKILPEALSSAIKEHKIKPAIYPKLELISAKDNENWQVRAITCNLPDVTIDDIKAKIEEKSKKDSIWTPDKAKVDDNKKKVLSNGEKEQIVINTIIENTQVNIPNILINEEVDLRLSKLVESIDKLGLTLDSYLASIGKTTDSLKDEYKKQAESSLKLELAINELVRKENISIDDKEIDEAIRISATDHKNIDKLIKDIRQREVISTVLKRRRVIDNLVSLL